MKIKARITLAIVSAAFLIPMAACADVPGAHPAYLHALTDLRDARWNLEHRPGDPAVSEQENIAVAEIDRAIGEVKTAAARDDKNLAAHPHEDAVLARPGRLHHAAELLRKAHADLAQEEDNPASRGLKHRALEHIDAALGATEHAIRDVEHGR
jgi:hypothetical protein